MIEKFIPRSAEFRILVGLFAALLVGTVLLAPTVADRAFALALMFVMAWVYTAIDRWLE